jgi:long-chain acyl-CoA synthetase
MAGTWTLDGLVHALAARGNEPALLGLRDGKLEPLSAAELANRATRLAAGLVQSGVRPGEPVALFAPNGPDWAVARLGIALAGGVGVAIDDTSTDREVEVLLRDSGCRRVFTAAAHVPAVVSALESAAVHLLDAGEGGPAPHYAALFAEAGESLPTISPDAPAALVYTSGTTGNPKSFVLRWRHIATNVTALVATGLVGSRDRALMPLPLHHVYPFVVGLLTPLTAGAAVVFPQSVSAAHLGAALSEARCTVIVGVPRLYRAMLSGIAARAAAAGMFARLYFRSMLALSRWARMRLRLKLGKILFRPLHARLGNALRTLVSGGAHLEPEVLAELEALGWDVYSGYGLAETASVFTGNRPGHKRFGSEGRVLSGQVRVAEPDAEGIGEIQLKGPSVFEGYRNNPEASAEAFAADGWFRTGDLGRVDERGYVYITGRAKEMIVLGGGKNVYPEELERVYGDSPYVAEVAVVEHEGSLVALVVPNFEAIRSAGVGSVEDAVRVHLADRARALPSFQRLAGFAIAREPLPRTRLGKYRRFLLPDLYRRQSRGAPRAAQEPSAEDKALLAASPAREIWAVLAERYRDRSLHLDAHPQLDLGIDSLEAMALSLAVEARTGLRLADEDIGAAQTVRDLLRRAASAEFAKAPVLSAEDLRWLDPPRGALRFVAAALHALNRIAVRLMFRLAVRGRDRLPAEGGFAVTPNHTSDADFSVIAAALPWRLLKRAHWGGDINRLFRSRAMRVLSRAMRVFPVDDRKPAASLALAAEVLKRGDILIWFPEEWRSPDGTLQPFRPGIGWLLDGAKAGAVPTAIRGTYAAMPRGRRWPRPGKVEVAFGAVQAADALAEQGEGESAAERITTGLRKAVAQRLREAGESTRIGGAASIASH